MNQLDERLRRVEMKIGRFEERLEAIDAWVIESRRFHQSVNSFMDTFNATQARIEKEQNVQHQANSAKLNWLLVIVTFFCGVVALAGVYIAYEEAHHQGVLMPLHSRKNPQVLAQESRIPELTR